MDSLVDIRGLLQQFLEGRKLFLIMTIFIHKVFLLSLQGLYSILFFLQLRLKAFVAFVSLLKVVLGMLDFIRVLLGHLFLYFLYHLIPIFRVIRNDKLFALL